jgi:hypothetical protein
MTYISRNLRHIAVATVAAMIGITATAAFGQEAATAAKQAAKAEYKDKNKSFCGNNHWSSEDKVSFSDLREMTLPASGNVTVDGGRNGGISIKGEERSDVLVRACVQTWGTTDEAARAVAANIKIGAGGTIKAENATDDKNWSVSYQIMVPRATNLNLRAQNGGISISGVDSSAEFETMNGGVSLSNVSGSMKGRTINGGVNVKLAGNSWRGSGLDVQTTNGGVHITMPSTYAARFETATVNGGFSSDIPGLQVEKTDENGHRRAVKISTDLNGGGAPIRAVTTNGGVRITAMNNQ